MKTGLLFPNPRRPVAKTRTTRTAPVPVRTRPARDVAGARQLQEQAECQHRQRDPRKSASWYHQLKLRREVERVPPEPPSLGHDHPFPAPLGHGHVRGDGEVPVQDVGRAPGGDVRVDAGVDELVSARRGAGPSRQDAGEPGVVQREDLVLGRLRHEDRLHLLQLVRHCRREVVVLRVVLGDVVQLPVVVVDGREDTGPHQPGRLRRRGRGDPPVVIDGAVADHLEVLGFTLGGSVGVGLVPGVRHAHAFDRPLLDAVHLVGLRNAGRLEDRRHDVDHVVELRPDASHVGDVPRPRHDHSLPGPAKVRRDLFGPFERRVERPGPHHGHVGAGLVRAPVPVVQQLQWHRDVGDAVVRRVRVVGALQGALGAGPVVAADVDDQRVVELALVLDLLDHPADFMVGVGDVGAEDLRLAGEELLLRLGDRVPRRAGRPATASSFAFAGMTPSRFWLAKMLSRMAFQPMSNLPLNLSIHSWVGWCGAWVPPGT